MDLNTMSSRNKVMGGDPRLTLCWHLESCKHKPSEQKSTLIFYFESNIHLGKGHLCTKTDSKCIKGGMTSFTISMFTEPLVRNHHSQDALLDDCGVPHKEHTLWYKENGLRC